MNYQARKKLVSNTLVALLLLPWLISCGDDPRLQEAEIIDNPAVTGSLGPHLSVAANGDVLMSWLASNSREVAVKFSRLSADGWSQPVAITRDDDLFRNWADFPGVVQIDDQQLVAHWLRDHPESQSGYQTFVSVSRDQGLSWSEGVLLHKDTSATEHGFVSAFPAGDGFGVVWLDGRAYASSGASDPGAALRYAIFNARGQRVSSIILDRRVCDCCQTDIATADGRSYLVYRDRTDTEARDIAFDVYRNGLWRGARKVTPDNWELNACPVNGAAIDANGRAVAYSWFTGAGDEPRIRLIRSLDRGETFAETVIGSSQRPLGRVDIVVLDDARIVLSWLERVSDGAELRAQMFDLHGRTGGYKVIANTSSSTRSGFPQMVRQGRDLIFAWTEAISERTRVRTARLPIAALDE